MEPTCVRRNIFAILALLLSVGYAFGVVSAAARDGILGVDYGVFYVAGDLIAGPGYAAAYETATFTPALRELYPDTKDISLFISPPTFGWVAQAFATVPFGLSIALWLAAGVAAVVAGSRVLELPNWTPFALLVSPMMVLSFTLGQTGALVFLLFACLHRQHLVGDQRGAGLLAALFVLKPTLAVGYGLLWTLAPRRFATSLVLACAGGVLVMLPTLVGGLAPWDAFRSSIIARVEVESDWAVQSSSVAEFIKLLAPHMPTEATLGSWAVGLLAGVGFMLLALRRHHDDVEMLSGAAAVATVLASPHIIIYDMVMLAIPLAIAHRRGVLSAARTGVILGVFAVAITLGPPLHALLYETFGGGIGLELPAMLVCVALLERWIIAGADGEMDQEAESVAVLADA